LAVAVELFQQRVQMEGLEGVGGIRVEVVMAPLVKETRAALE